MNHLLYYLQLNSIKLISLNMQLNLSSVLYNCNLHVFFCIILNFIQLDVTLSKPNTNASFNLLYLAGFCCIYDTVGLGGEVQGGPKPSNWQMHIVKVMKEVIHSHRVKRLHADRRHSFTLTQANYIHTCMCTQTQASTRKATGSCAPFRLIQSHKAQTTLPSTGLRK